MEATAATVRIGQTVWSSENPNRTAEVATDQAVILAEGEFLMRFHNTGYQCIGRFTGRTRQFFGGIACRTFDRYDIETVVIDGAIWGVSGAKLDGGTWAVR